MKGAVGADTLEERQASRTKRRRDLPNGSSVRKAIRWMIEREETGDEEKMSVSSCSCKGVGDEWRQVEEKEEAAVDDTPQPVGNQVLGDREGFFCVEELT